MCFRGAACGVLTAGPQGKSCAGLLNPVTTLDDCTLYIFNIFSVPGAIQAVAMKLNNSFTYKF